MSCLEPGSGTSFFKCHRVPDQARGFNHRGKKKTIDKLTASGGHITLSRQRPLRTAQADISPSTMAASGRVLSLLCRSSVRVFCGWLLPISSVPVFGGFLRVCATSSCMLKGYFSFFRVTSQLQPVPQNRLAEVGSPGKMKMWRSFFIFMSSLHLDPSKKNQSC